MPSKKSKRPYDLRVNFGYYKETYRQEIQKSIAFIGQDLAFFTEAKVKKLLELVRRSLGDPSKLNILDVGCGVGLTDYYLTGHFKKVHGIDVDRGVVEKAEALNPKAAYRYYAGKTLPYKDHSMDVTFAICVMHHVVPEGWDRFAEEMIRVTKKGGLVIVFEHNPLNPLTQVAVHRCELDDDAVLLGMGKVRRLFRKAVCRLTETGYLIFTPYRSPVFSALDRWLSWLPLGAQYYVCSRIENDPKKI